jgi:serine/threonine-protein phosphatase 2A activator
MAQLRQVKLEEIAQLGELRPSLMIKFEEDVAKWKTTQSYQDYGIFLQKLSDSVVNVYLPWSPEVPAEVGDGIVFHGYISDESRGPPE